VGPVVGGSRGSNYREITFPSLGVGIELGIANELDKPVILFHLENPSVDAEHRYYKNPDDSSHELQIGKGGISCG
jgi:hypothetical protein